MNCICCKKWSKCICHREGDMAEIYCSDIDSLGCVDEGGKPPFVPTCGEEEPDYITPEQYKERTGREYPANGVVKIFCVDSDGVSYSVFDEYHYEGCHKGDAVVEVYCAFGDLVPPDDWRQE